jgi:hypothetical protein
MTGKTVDRNALETRPKHAGFVAFSFKEKKQPKVVWRSENHCLVEGETR